MGELRIYEFDPRLVVYGFSRREALRNVERILNGLRAAEPTVALAEQHPTMDRAWLKRKGIEPEGTATGLSPSSRPPGFDPPPDWMVARERERRANRATDPE